MKISYTLISSVESENVPRLKSENVQESKIKFSFTIGGNGGTFLFCEFMGIYGHLTVKYIIYELKRKV